MKFIVPLEHIVSVFSRKIHNKYLFYSYFTSILRINSEDCDINLKQVEFSFDRISKIFVSDMSRHWSTFLYFDLKKVY